MAENRAAEGRSASAVASIALTGKFSSWSRMSIAGTIGTGPSATVSSFATATSSSDNRIRRSGRTSAPAKSLSSP